MIFPARSLRSGTISLASRPAAPVSPTASNGDLVTAKCLPRPAANNSGPTFTHALLVGSAAIDAAASITGSTDQRGRSHNGTADDIGAYELLIESYAYWTAHTFSAATNTAENQNYDGYGKSNGLEFGAGSDPTNALSTPMVIPSRSGSNDIANCAISPLAPTGQVVSRSSTNLTSWSSIAANLYQIVGSDPTVRLSSSGSALPRASGQSCSYDSKTTLTLPVQPNDRSHSISFSVQRRMGRKSSASPSCDVSLNRSPTDTNPSQSPKK